MQKKTSSSNTCYLNENHDIHPLIKSTTPSLTSKVSLFIKQNDKYKIELQVLALTPKLQLEKMEWAAMLK
jgi:hypothetical protein